MKIIVYTPEERLSESGNQRGDRHTKIVQLLSGFDVIEDSDPQIKFINEEEKLIAKEFIDQEGNILVAHYSDLTKTRSGNFEELLELKNAIAIYHTDSWNNNNFLTQQEAKELFDLEQKSIAVGSDVVQVNIRKFVQKWIETKNIELSYFELIGFDPILEKLFEPFISLSPFSKLSDIATNKDKKPIKDKEGKTIIIEKAKQYLNSYVKSKLIS